MAAKLLNEIEATAGPAVHTRSVGPDGLTPEGSAVSKRRTVKTRDLAIVRNEVETDEQPTEERATVEVEQTPVAAVAVVKPQLYRCNNHCERFPGEAQMLPLEAFPIRAEDGHRRGVYCKRCQSKLHTEYGRRKRQAARSSVDALNARVEAKRAELEALEQQLHDALEAQITKVEAE